MATDLLDYDYELPDALIAQEPAIPRDSSRLMVLHRAERRWEHRRFKDLSLYLDENDLMIANNTQVLKARLQGRRLLQKSELEGSVLSGKVEFLLLEEIRPRVWEGLIHASARTLPGFCFEVPTPDGQRLRGTVVSTGVPSAGTVFVEFDGDPIESRAGTLPLPPYIRPASEGGSVESQYQTVYAKNPGSAAAPTAGLHFTPEVLAALKARGASWGEVTLHVGVGTFRPVKERDIRNHVMHEERYEVSTEVATQVTQWKEQRRRVLAVGTTSVRTLESAWEGSKTGRGFLKSGEGRASLFIRPGAFDFKVVDRLLTNFHLPRSTLLMLVSTFADRELILEAYQEAIREKYRFFSFGDALLIL